MGGVTTPPVTQAGLGSCLSPGVIVSPLCSLCSLNCPTRKTKNTVTIVLKKAPHIEWGQRRVASRTPPGGLPRWVWSLEIRVGLMLLDRGRSPEVPHL